MKKLCNSSSDILEKRQIYKKYDLNKVIRGPIHNAYNRQNLGSIPSKNTNIIFKGVRQAELDKIKYLMSKTNDSFSIEGSNIKYSFSNSNPKFNFDSLNINNSKICYEKSAKNNNRLNISSFNNNTNFTNSCSHNKTNSTIIYAYKQKNNKTNFDMYGYGYKNINNYNNIYVDDIITASLNSVKNAKINEVFKKIRNGNIYNSNNTNNTNFTCNNTNTVNNTNNNDNLIENDNNNKVNNLNANDANYFAINDNVIINENKDITINDNNDNNNNNINVNINDPSSPNNINYLNANIDNNDNNSNINDEDITHINNNDFLCQCSSNTNNTNRNLYNFPIMPKSNSILSNKKIFTILRIKNKNNKTYHECNQNQCKNQCINENENKQLSKDDDNKTNYRNVNRKNLEIIHPKYNFSCGKLTNFSTKDINKINYFGLSERFNYKDNLVSKYYPGPGDYNMEDKRRKFTDRYGSLFKNKNNHALVKEEINLSPGQYETFNKGNGKLFSFAKGEKKLFSDLINSSKNKNNPNGPGYYDIKSTINIKRKNHLSYFFMDNINSNNSNINKNGIDINFLHNKKEKEKEKEKSNKVLKENDKSNLVEIRKFVYFNRKNYIESIKKNNEIIYNNINSNKIINNVNDKGKENSDNKGSKRFKELLEFQRNLLTAKHEKAKIDKGFALNLSPKKGFYENKHYPGPCYYDYDKISNFYKKNVYDNNVGSINNSFSHPIKENKM